MSMKKLIRIALQKFGLFEPTRKAIRQLKAVALILLDSLPTKIYRPIVTRRGPKAIFNLDSQEL